MYTDHFQLSQRPFSRVPTATGCVMFPGLQTCFERACECIDDFAGPALIVSSSGCGKSTLLAILERHYQQRELTTVNLNCAAITCRQEMIQCLLFELGLPFTSENVGELRLKLIDHLKSDMHCPNGILLLVDEADGLSHDVLEELRMITNLICGSQQQIRLVLAGDRGLEEKLMHPQMNSFNQRIGTRCYLEPMTRTETMYYALAQMQMCGRDGREIFKPSALDRVHDLTGGVPRLAAQLCDRALKLAANHNETTIDGDSIQRAWLDVQQLPAIDEPIATLPTSNEGPGIIEFGSLDDGPNEEELKLEPLPGTDNTTKDQHHQTSAESTEESFELPQHKKEESTAEGVVNIEAFRDEHGEEIPSPSLMRFPEQDTSDQPESEPIEVASPETSPRVDSTLDDLLRQIDEIDNPSIDFDEGLVAKASQTDEPEIENRRKSDRRSGDRRVASAPDEIAAEEPQISALDSSGVIDASATGPNPDEKADFTSLSKAIASAHALSDLQYEEEQREIAERVDLADEARAQNSGRVEPTAEDLFGDSFDQEEQILDAQSNLVADQNRVSSSLTSDLVSNLAPEVTSSDEIDAIVEQVAAAGEEEPSPRKTGAIESNQDCVADSISEFQDGVTSIAPTSLPHGNTSLPSGQNLPADDSDMLVTGQPQEVAAAESILQPPPEPTAEKPQGQVIRMNYQELFRQLRSQTPTSET